MGNPYNLQVVAIVTILQIYQHVLLFARERNAKKETLTLTLKETLAYMYDKFFTGLKSKCQRSSV